MRFFVCLVAVFVLCGFSPEPGDISGWNFVRSLPVGASVHGVGVAHAPLPVHHGKTSLRFEIRPGDCSAGKHGWDDCTRDRERAELKQTDYQRHGETWWYKFSIFVPAGHRNIWPAKLSFAQFHQEGAKPAIMLQNHKGGLWLDVHDGSGTKQLIPLISRAVFAGEWHDVVLSIRWSRNRDGYISAEINGKNVAQYRGATMSAQKVYFKFGLYRSHLIRAGNVAQVTHRAYFDRIVRAPTREGLFDLTQ